MSPKIKRLAWFIGIYAVSLTAMLGAMSLLHVIVFALKSIA